MTSVLIVDGRLGSISAVNDRRPDLVTLPVVSNMYIDFLPVYQLIARDIFAEKIFRTNVAHFVGKDGRCAIFAFDIFYCRPVKAARGFALYIEKFKISVFGYSVTDYFTRRIALFKIVFFYAPF